jgi:hypothetical protein
MIIQSTNNPAGFCTLPLSPPSIHREKRGANVTGIYSFVVQPLEGKAQIALSAQTISGIDVDYGYFCNFTVIGTLV